MTGQIKLRGGTLREGTWLAGWSPTFKVAQQVPSVASSPCGDTRQQHGRAYIPYSTTDRLLVVEW
jgi:hypothetical protein